MTILSGTAILSSLLREELPQWNEQQQKAFSHSWRQALGDGVLALCHHQLNIDPIWQRVNKDTQQRLIHYTSQQAAVELLEAQEIAAVLEDFHQAGLHPLLMKGTPLAYTLYPKPYLRSRCDTDFLFKDRAQADQAGTILIQRGYRTANAVDGQLVTHERAYMKDNQTGTKHTLDIHWKLSNTQFFANAFDYDELSAEAIPVPQLSPYARTLHNRHALALACMHRMSHMKFNEQNRLIWLYDIHLLANQFDAAAWDKFLQEAQQKNLCAICLDGLQQTQQQLKTNLPERLLQQLHDHAQNETITPQSINKNWKYQWMDIRSLPTWQSRLRLLREHLFPSPAYMLKKYHSDNKFLLPYFYMKRVALGIIRQLRK